MKVNDSIDKPKFKNIISKYDEEYKEAQNIYSVRPTYANLRADLTTFCAGFTNNERGENEKIVLKPFFEPCRKLGRYLFYIQNIEDLVDRIRNCIYFCYKLEEELKIYVKDYTIHIGESYKKYELPDNLSTVFKTFINVCPGFDDYPGDITLEILENLENIQKIIQKFYSNHGGRNLCMVNYNESKYSLNNNKYNCNESLNSMLDDIKNLYDKKCPIENTQSDSSEMYTQESEITSKGNTENTNNISGTKLSESHSEGKTVLSMNRSVTDKITQTSAGVNIGTFSLISIILIAIFILYKVKNKNW